MKAKLRQKALELRLDEELSYGEIRRRLKVSKSTLSYWLRDYPLAEEKILELRRKGWEKGETARERFRATMRKKKEERTQRVYRTWQKKLKNVTRDAFFVAGLMLYLGEGSKKDPYSISLANTDARIIVFFMKWLADFLDVTRKDIKAALHLYENMDIGREKKHWENALKLPKSQFYKPQIRKLRKASFLYKESFRHGTCSIYVFSGEKKTELMMAIQAFLDMYMSK